MPWGGMLALVVIALRIVSGMLVLLLGIHYHILDSSELLRLKWSHVDALSYRGMVLILLGIWLIMTAGVNL